MASVFDLESEEGETAAQTYRGVGAGGGMAPVAA